MFNFRKLLKLIDKELGYQEQLLKLLVRERTAIVKLQQDELEAISDEKMKLLEQAIAAQRTREDIFLEIQSERGGDSPLKFSEVVAMCPASEGKGPLTLAGDKLKKVATSVKELNDENATLIKHSLGLIASTVSIMTAAPETDLPTYNAGGRLHGDSEDPAFIQRRPMTREA